VNATDALVVVGKLLLAIALGGAIGWERESVDRPAGFRTHVLVCVGSAVYMLVSLAFQGPQSDPARIAAQVASGMGFLGAGTILRHGSVVRGLTTAASLWTVAAIGLGVGTGLYLIAVLAAGAVILTLSALAIVEKRLMSKRQYRTLFLRLRNAREIFGDLQRELGEMGLVIPGAEFDAVRGEAQEVRLRARVPPGVALSEITARLVRRHEVEAVDWE